eukprot:4293678-Pyramimonas_sp.AAC.1
MSLAVWTWASSGPPPASSSSLMASAAWSSTATRWRPGDRLAGSARACARSGAPGARSQDRSPTVG